MRAGPPRPAQDRPARVPVVPPGLPRARSGCPVRGSGIPAQDANVIVVTAATAARYGPRLLAALDTVSARLTTGSLRALDAQVELRGQDPRPVASSWLRAHGVVSAGVTHVG